MPKLSRKSASKCKGESAKLSRSFGRLAALGVILVLAGLVGLV